MTAQTGYDSVSEGFYVGIKVRNVAILGGDVIAAYVYHHIQQSVWADGSEHPPDWVKATYEQMADTLCLSAKQVKRAIQVLRDHEMIESRRAHPMESTLEWRPTGVARIRA